MVVKLPCEVPQQEHVVEEIVHRGPSWRVVAGYGAELRLRVLGHQSGSEDFLSMWRPQSATRPGTGLCPRVGGGRLAVVGPEEP